MILGLIVRAIVPADFVYLCVNLTHVTDWLIHFMISPKNSSTKFPTLINKQSLDSYKQSIDLIIRHRLKIMLIVISIMYIAFGAMDSLLVPEYSESLLKMRIGVSMFFLLLYAICCTQFGLKYVRSINDIAWTVGNFGMAIINLCDGGSSSIYFFGAIYMSLVYVISNSFEYMRTIFFITISTSVYMVSCLLARTPWDAINFTVALSLSSGIYVFIITLAIMYENQYRKQFFASEELKANEILLNDSYQRVKRDAGADPLTKLLNRRSLTEILSARMQISRQKRTPFYLLFFDIDNFKVVNDRYGHIVGDEVLVKLSEVTVKAFRKGTTIARYGGDEFVIILEGATKEEVGGRIDDLCKRIQSIEFKRNGTTFHISGSFGATCYDSTRFEHVDDFIQAADEAMLKIKREKRKNHINIE